MHNRPTRFELLALGGLIVASLLVRWPLCTDALHLSDSADYLRAARRGVWANYTDKDSTSLWSFLEKYLRDREFRDHPWAQLMRDGDIAALRHFHVPLFIYPHAVLARLSASDRSHRILTSAVVAIALGVAFACLRRMGVRLAYALVGILVLSTSAPLLAITAEISPYPMYFVFATLLLYLAGGPDDFGRSRRLLAAALVGAAAIVTLEFSVLLALAILAHAIAEPHCRHALVQLTTYRSWARPAVWMMAGLFVLWPAGFLKGGYLLSYGVYAFIVVMRRTEYYETASYDAMLQRLGSGDLLLGAAYLVAGLAASLWVWRRSADKPSRVFGAYCLCALAQGIGNNFRNETYVAHYLFFMWLVAILALEDAARRRPRLELGYLSSLAGIVLLAVWLPAQLRFSAVRKAELADTSARIKEAIGLLRAFYPPKTVFLTNRHYEALGAYAPEFSFEPGRWQGKLVPRAPMKGRLHVLLVDSRALTTPQRAALGALCDLGDAGFAVDCASLSGPPAGPGSP